MANRKGFRAAWLTVIALLCAVRLVAGDADPAQPYEQVSYPTFANGRLRSLLVAKKAVVYDLTEGTPRINLEDVLITLYDHSQASLDSTPDDQPLPVEMTITSDRGFFTRRPPEPGSPPEEVVNLEGNVVVRQMRVSSEPLRPSLRPPRLSPEYRLDPGIETEIRCEHAQWNNTLRKLNGDGEVVFIQEDSRIFGTGFLYLADDEAMGTTGGGTSNIKNWGGIIFIEHNARMEIDRDGTRTEITCRDTASYKLREREIQFERDVKVRRPGLTIESDILKVFLRQESDPVPESSPDNAPVPGQVKSIIATIGKRPGSVIITGFKVEPDGREGPAQFLAKGGRADFDYDNDHITLIDTREQRWPEVEFGADRDRIMDDNLIFSYVKQSESGVVGSSESHVLDTLNTFGGHGQVVLRTRQAGADAGPTIPTKVVYQGEMNYTRGEGRIRFSESVVLERGELYIKSELLDVRLTSDGVSPEPNQVNRIIAETDVVIRTAEREANAHRAEYEIYEKADLENNAVDSLRLYGPPQRTPPHPWVRDHRGNQISAPEIRMYRLQTPIGQKARHLLWAGNGVANCDFYADPDDPSDEPRIITIKCEKGMQYDERIMTAQFEGQVLATSDAPQDNYVLSSERLILNFKESPSPEMPGEDKIWVRRITAEGRARLVQDARTCEGIRIIRDFPTMNPNDGSIYLQGAAAQDSRPAQLAVYREQNGAQIGSMFAAILIKSSASGDRIEANGPGQLSQPDELPGYRSEIHFGRYASYESFPDSLASQATFSKDVVLRQPSRNLVITSDELYASFLRDEEPADKTPAEGIDYDRIGRLRRAEFKTGVKVDAPTPKGRRVAVGDRGSIDFETAGNIIKMSMERKNDGSRNMVMVQDDDGMTLHSPAVEMREGQGYMRADGPGELHIPGDRNGDGVAALPTAVWFGDRGSMVYNELALNIKISDRVRIVQPGAGPTPNWRSPSLDGTCDRLEIQLFEPPMAGMERQAALTRVQKMDAFGNVIIRVYADPPPNNPNIDWLSRPGTTFFTRGDRGEFFVPENRIEISGSPGRPPQLLLSVVDSGRPPHRQRMKAERFILDTNVRPRRWSFHGQPESNTLREGEPFEFVD